MSSARVPMPTGPSSTFDMPESCKGDALPPGQTNRVSEFESCVRINSDESETTNGSIKVVQGPVLDGIVSQVKMVSSACQISAAVQSKVCGSPSGLHIDAVMLEAICFLPITEPLNVKSFVV